MRQKRRKLEIGEEPLSCPAQNEIPRPGMAERTHDQKAGAALERLLLKQGSDAGALETDGNRFGLNAFLLEAPHQTFGGIGFAQRLFAEHGEDTDLGGAAKQVLRVEDGAGGNAASIPGYGHAVHAADRREFRQHDCRRPEPNISASAVDALVGLFASQPHRT